MAKDKTEVDIIDVERELYGYDGGVKTYIPECFEAMKIPEDKRFSVDICPLSDSDCSKIRNINNTIKVELYMWCHEKGIDPSKVLTSTTLETMAYLKQIEILDKPSEKFAVVFPYISNLQNHKHKEFTFEVWQSMPNKIRESIYNAIIDISNVSTAETINLS